MTGIAVRLEVNERIGNCMKGIFSNENVFRPTSDPDIFMVSKRELLAHLPQIKMRHIISKNDLEWCKNLYENGIAEGVQDCTNHMLEEICRRASKEFGEFFIKNGIMECEQSENEYGPVLEFKIHVWAEPKED